MVVSRCWLALTAIRGKNQGHRRLALDTQLRSSIAQMAVLPELILSGAMQ